MNKVSILWLSINMLNQFKDYFYFNRTERKGVLSLLFLLAIVIIFNQSMIYFNPDPLNSQEKYNSLMAKIDSVAKLDSLKAVEYEVKYKVERVKTILDFNPNELTSQGWQNLGLSEKQAQVILNYKAKAGEFKSKASVKKMFVISDSLYAKIEPHILLPENDPPKEYKDNFNKEKWKEKPRKKKAYPKVLFNTADTAELKKISGIGSFLSKNIVKYRESLGGFHNKKQLK